MVGDRSGTWARVERLHDDACPRPAANRQRKTKRHVVALSAAWRSSLADGESWGHLAARGDTWRRGRRRPTRPRFTCGKTFGIPAESCQQRFMLFAPHGSCVDVRTRTTNERQHGNETMTKQELKTALRKATRLMAARDFYGAIHACNQVLRIGYFTDRSGTRAKIERLYEAACLARASR